MGTLVSDNNKKSSETREKIGCVSIVIHEDVISMCVVPVNVKFRNSSIVYSTFAMIDYWS